jgi:hypothetical protein
MTQVSTAATDLKPARQRRPASGTRREGAGAVQFPPNTKARPTLREILDAVEQSHRCTDDLRKEVQLNHVEAIGKIGELDSKVDGLELKVAKIEGGQEAANRILGAAMPADKDGPSTKGKTPFALHSTPKVVWSIIAAVAGGGAVLKLGLAVAPAIWGVWLAILHFWLGASA